jgi:serine/threonine-protein kinase
LRDLLARHAAVETGDFLNTLPKFTVADSDLNRPTQDGFEPGTIIGPYQLVRELGRGGMGEVWLAARSDGALTRRVALKLPHAHLLSGALRQRFERERDILAPLSHPHIAPLYDAGISDGGHPYLAMEWIDGMPITHYCREVRQPIATRLELFKQVLDAVHYAHERFIAHRDLKPSNILVTSDGRVKLLDFGIAKLLSGDTGGASTELTQLGGRAATPDYAAPEQIAGQPITTAVDLYALGVVLFELLTGARPFDAVRGVNTHSSSAPLASQRVTEAEAQLIGGLKSAQLRKSLQGDLDAILAKALETDPAQRYRSAALSAPRTHLGTADQPADAGEEIRASASAGNCTDGGARSRPARRDCRHRLGGLARATRSPPRPR